MYYFVGKFNKFVKYPPYTHTELRDGHVIIDMRL